MSAAGAPPGFYHIGPRQVEVGSDGVVHLPCEKQFAGSSLTMDRGVENDSEWLGLTLSQATEMHASLPAGHFGSSCDHIDGFQRRVSGDFRVPTTNLEIIVCDRSSPDTIGKCRSITITSSVYLVFFLSGQQARSQK